AKSMSRYLIDTIEDTPNITVRTNAEVAAAHGDEQLERITVRDRAGGADEEMELAAMFVFIGARPQTEWLPSDVARDKRGFVLGGTELLAREGAPRRRVRAAP